MDEFIPLRGSQDRATVLTEFRPSQRQSRRFIRFWERAFLRDRRCFLRVIGALRSSFVEKYFDYKQREDRRITLV